VIPFRPSLEIEQAKQGGIHKNSIKLTSETINDNNNNEGGSHFQRKQSY